MRHLLLHPQVTSPKQLLGTDGFRNHTTSSRPPVACQPPVSSGSGTSTLALFACSHTLAWWFACDRCDSRALLVDGCISSAFLLSWNKSCLALPTPELECGAYIRTPRHRLIAHAGQRHATVLGVVSVHSSMIFAMSE